jgi:hypothetical protein
MFILLIIFFLLVSLIFWLLLTPVCIEIDTDTGILKVVYGSVAEVSALNLTEHPQIRVRIFGIAFNIDPFRRGSRRKIIERKPGRKSGVSGSRMGRMMLKMFRSFKLKQFEMNLDTGDFFWNALLIPVFVNINRENHFVHINFMDRNSLHLKIENRAINF